ncbi:MAG: dihydroneopterin aldolase [Flavobacteriales bacterium]|nr:MAG: dihydroneopterin aldolase [Flavobacteriales bacterium]
MGQVKLENIKVYAHHGCLEEETIIGSHYRVDVSLSANLTKPMFSDRLTDTIDYVHINHIVKEEMKISSKLLEHVAHRIIERIFSEIDLVRKVKVSVSKINPPIGGDVEMVTIILSRKKDVS